MRPEDIGKSSGQIGSGDEDQELRNLHQSAKTLALMGLTNAQLCAEVREAANVARDAG